MLFPSVFCALQCSFLVSFGFASLGAIVSFLMFSVPSSVVVFSRPFSWVRVAFRRLCPAALSFSSDPLAVHELFADVCVQFFGIFRDRLVGCKLLADVDVQLRGRFSANV